MIKIALSEHIFRSSLIILLFITTISCSAKLADKIHITPCSTEWYKRVESQISTGDKLGHGPDIGSAEWRSVIEFKLGIRGKSTKPPLSSQQWCEYIEKNYIILN